MDLTELIEMGSNQGIGRTSLHLVDPGENPRSHLLQLPGAPASLAQGPPSLFKATRGASSDFSLHLTLTFPHLCFTDH